MEDNKIAGEQQEQESAPRGIFSRIFKKPPIQAEAGEVQFPDPSAMISPEAAAQMGGAEGAEGQAPPEEPAEEEPIQDCFDRMIDLTTPLGQLWLEWPGRPNVDNPLLCDYPPAPTAEGVDPRFVIDLAPFVREYRSYEDKLQKMAQRALNVEESRDILSITNALDAQVVVWVTKDSMEGWIVAFPPRGGRELTAEIIYDALEKEGVRDGIDQALVEQVAQELPYFQIVTVARGKSPIDGIDGSVEDHFPRESRIEFQEDEHGVVDYRELNLIHDIASGEALCDITKPVPAIDGVTLRGKPLRGKPGKPAHVPQGRNTKLNEDGSKLVAAIDGHVVFDNERFIVEPLLNIEGDVDKETGNLTFSGDIVIGGDIRGGYRVTAGGSITIKGMVEEANIQAGGDIIVSLGMNGNSNGTLVAKGSIKCKFLENCIVQAGGNIYADSIVCCTVFCDGKISVMSDRGSIIGGELTVAGDIEAVNIGSRSNRLTVITMGSTPSLISDREETQKQLEELQESLQRIAKDISFMELRAGDPKNKIKLSQYKLQKSLLQMKVEPMQKHLAEVEEQLSHVEKCKIRCQTMYPEVKISIGGATTTVQQVYRNCLVFYGKDNKGEVVVTSL